MKRLALAPLALAFAAACGPHAREARHCSETADCAPDGFCRSGRCAASSAPAASVIPPAAPLLSHTLLRFDGSGSSDPDPEDHIASWSWSVRRVGAACDPFPASGSDAAIEVVFGCGGTFEVRLVVADGTGRSSDPATVEVSIEASADAPAVTTGPDLAVQHSCQGTPVVCALDDGAGGSSVRLAATAASPVSAAFTYAWSVEPPPGLVGKPPPQVTIAPPDAPDPMVRIETAGTAIAGEYVFTVRATDEFRLVAVGHQKVMVGNRPPVVGGGGSLQVPHLFEAAASRFRATGSVPPVTVSDPDGDPLALPGFSARSAGDGGAAFEVLPLGATADFTIVVPYTRPEDAGFLIGGPGLVRQIVYAAEDPNGGWGEAAWDVVVTNRAPHVTGTRNRKAGHGFQRDAGRYFASVPVLDVADDDGDPIVQRAPTGDAICSAVPGLVGGGTVAVECALAYAGVPAMGQFGGFHAVSVVVGDPWEALPALATSVTVTDRPPVLTVAPVSIPVPVTTGTSCCEIDPATKECLAFAEGHGSGSAVAPFLADDPDGDPVYLALVPPACVGVLPAATATCVPGSCPDLTITVCEKAPACYVPSWYTVPATATDGAQTASADLQVLLSFQ